MWDQGSNLCLLQWRQCLNHWTIKEVPLIFFLFLKVYIFKNTLTEISRIIFDHGPAKLAHKVPSSQILPCLVLKLNLILQLRSFCSPPPFWFFRTPFLDSSKKVLSPVYHPGLGGCLEPAGHLRPLYSPSKLSPQHQSTPTAQPTAHLGKLGGPSSCIWTPSTPLWNAILWRSRAEAQLSLAPLASLNPLRILFSCLLQGQVQIAEGPVTAEWVTLLSLK